MPNVAIYHATVYDLNIRPGVNAIYVATLPSSTVTNALTAGIVAATVGHLGLVSVESIYYGPSVAAGGTGPYSTSRDIAILQFQYADNSIGEITCPAPLASCFDSTTLKVLPAGPLATLIAAIIAYTYNILGSPCVSYIDGWRDQIPALLVS
jgi:hypothetical protein